MARSDRLKWVSNGSPFRLMTPARDLRDVLRRHGYTVYDIGNQDHLEHEPPEDHTPYSETGYPGRATYGVGYAIDIMPPPAGARSKVDGQPLPLPSLQKLGAQLLADRKAGVPGIKWLKYMNWEPTRDNGGPCYQDSWRPTYARRSSSDRGHIHASGLTGYDTSTIAAGYDPVARIRGEDMFDKPDADRLVRLEKTAQTIDRKLADLHWVFVNGPTGSGAYVGKWMVEMAAKAGVDEAAIVRDVLVGLTPEKIAAAIPPTLAKQVVDELARQLAQIE